VHRVDLFCQSCRHHRAVINGQFCGHRAALGARFPRRANRRFVRGLYSGRTVHRKGDPMTITIYHNPNCGTSRNVLAAIRERGEEPVVIEYLKAPPSRETLKALIAAMGGSVRAVLRRRKRWLPDLA